MVTAACDLDAKFVVHAAAMSHCGDGRATREITGHHSVVVAEWESVGGDAVVAVDTTDESPVDGAER